MGQSSNSLIIDQNTVKPICYDFELDTSREAQFVSKKTLFMWL